MSTPLPVSLSVPSPAMLDTMTKIIMSQTEMTHEEVQEALVRTNYDLKRVIREYMRGGAGGSESATQRDTVAAIASANQLRFAEIRSFMDKSAELYYRKQEMSKIYQQVLEKKQAQAQAQAQAQTQAQAQATTEEVSTAETTVSKL